MTEPKTLDALDEHKPMNRQTVQKPLSDEQIRTFFDYVSKHGSYNDFLTFARAIEQAHGII